MRIEVGVLSVFAGLTNLKISLVLSEACLEDIAVLHAPDSGDFMTFAIDYGLA